MSFHSEHGNHPPKPITILNINAPNLDQSNSIKYTLLSIKGQISSNTVVIGDFSTQLSPIDRSPRQKVNREISESNNIAYQMNPTDV